VFARRAVAAGEHVGWYAGELISAEEADDRHSRSDQPEHTMFFARGDGQVIDGSRGGNETRFLNHGCEPNCFAQEADDGRIGFVADTDVPAGGELFIDYQLQIDPADAALYPCHCGAARCRGTMAAS